MTTMTSPEDTRQRFEADVQRARQRALVLLDERGPEEVPLVEVVRTLEQDGITRGMISMALSGLVADKVLELTPQLAVRRHLDQ